MLGIMKKTAIMIFAALLLCSCNFDDAEWGGTYSYGEYAGYEYMISVADNLIVDNLKQMEAALYVNSMTGSTSSRFERSGELWSAGAKWTVTKKGGDLEGLHINKADADSTWTLARNGKYTFGSDYDRYGYYYDDDDEVEKHSFDTDYEMDVKMLPDTTAYAKSDHFWWKVTLKKCIRTEEKGYRAEFTTKADAPLVYTYGTFGNWNSCEGVLLMQVYKYSDVVDVARLELTGAKSGSQYIHNL